MQYEVGQVHPILTSIGDNMLGSWPASIVEVREHGVILRKFEASIWNREFRTWEQLKLDAEWDSKWVGDPRRPDDVWDRALSDDHLKLEGCWEYRSEYGYHLSEMAAEDAWLRKAENNWNWS
jgi:hypothetical protein